MSDQQIVRYNSVGLSLSTIGSRLGLHPTTIKLRLDKMGVSPADTRRTFMEDLYNSLNASQQDWLADQLGPHISIKDYLRNLLVKEYLAQQKPGAPNV